MGTCAIHSLYTESHQGQVFITLFAKFALNRLVWNFYREIRKVHREITAKLGYSDNRGAAKFSDDRENTCP